jgi:hypothetical protein
MVVEKGGSNMADNNFVVLPAALRKKCKMMGEQAIGLLATRINFIDSCSW